MLSDSANGKGVTTAPEKYDTDLGNSKFKPKQDQIALHHQGKQCPKNEAERHSERNGKRGQRVK